ncbi:MAG: LLM class flavin-dependent oxidoreductase [Egibacteraceae bacterium]
MGEQLRLGLALGNFVPSEEPLRFDDLATYATRAERLGFSSVFAWDHLFLGTKTYFPFLESLTVLAALAARTQRIRLGTGVLVLPLRDPTTLAKVTSTIDLVSGGRFVLGAAAGWYEKEYEALGIPFSRRGKVLVRNLEILKRLWTEDSMDYEAEGLDGSPGALRFRRVVMQPKPLQRPRPTILLGGYVDVVLKRIARHADGWLTYLYRPPSFAQSWGKLREYAEQADRDPDTLRNVSQVPICVGDSYQDADRRVKHFVQRYFDVPPWSQASAESAIRGTPQQCAEQIAEHARVGVQELVLMPVDYDLEQVEAIGQELLPVFSPDMATPGRAR